MVLRWFSRSDDAPSEPQDSELVRTLREAGAEVLTSGGEPVRVEFDQSADDSILELLRGSATIETLGLDWCYQMTDAGLSVLSTLPALRQLKLNGADITGAGLAALKDHPNLELIELDGSSIQDESLKHLGDVPHLTSVFLRYTSITSAGIPYLCAIPRLSVLHLDGSAVDGQALKSIREMRKLEVLSLPSGIHGEDLQALNGFGSLRWLWLGDASVDSASVEELRSTLNPMCSVSWRRK